MRVTFREVSLYGQKSVKCRGGCGRRLRRSKKFWQTLSPFNINSNRVPKTPEEIYAELKIELKAWKDSPETCAHCLAQK